MRWIIGTGEKVEKRKRGSQGVWANFKTMMIMKMMMKTEEREIRWRQSENKKMDKKRKIVWFGYYSMAYQPVWFIWCQIFYVNESLVD